LTYRPKGRISPIAPTVPIFVGYSHASLDVEFIAATHIHDQIDGGVDD
jgi:hypothetical protein